MRLKRRAEYVPYPDGSMAGAALWGHDGNDEAWAVLHCYATYEDLVIEKIKKRVPHADVRRLKFPGCIAWRWTAPDWDDVRNAGGITGYVGDPGPPELHSIADLE